MGGRLAAVLRGVMGVQRVVRLLMKGMKMKTRVRRRLMMMTRRLCHLLLVCQPYVMPLRSWRLLRRAYGRHKARWGVVWCGGVQVTWSTGVNMWDLY
jgi:hypothetical protein